MENFEELIAEYKGAVERFVKFRLPDKTEAEDVLQEVFLSAYQKFDQLKKKETFQAWLIGIARNKCNDWFRAKAKCMELPVERLTEKMSVYSRHGRTETGVVRETLELLGDKDKQILYLYFFKELPQTEIAARLQIPLGTVKSRLHTAKQNFKKQYPFYKNAEGADVMKRMPEYIPEYTIEESKEAPFTVKWEEMMGWFIVPKLGEKLAWAMYDFPEKKRTEHTYMEVIGRAEVHGIEGVEITAVEYDPMDCNQTDNVKKAERRFVAQLTDTHCRALAEMHLQDGVKKYYTFLDGDAFLDNWGFGEDNCGNETNLAAKGDIIRQGDVITSEDKKFLLDVVGRYRVTIGGKQYDTICVMDIETYNGGVASEQFLDKNGRTILWRRYNKDDWAIDRFGQKWSERFPDNDRLTINGNTYVHWYDCITDYIL